MISRFMASDFCSTIPDDRCPEFLEVVLRGGILALAETIGIYIYLLYITCHIYYSWRLSSVGGSLHLRRLQIQTLMLRFISHYYQSYVIYTNWLFVFCTYNIIWVMFWIPKYNQKSHTDCFIIYRQWCNPIGNWKYFHLFQFCENVLPGTCPSGNGISWIVWNKKNVFSYPTLQGIFFTVRIISSSNSQPQPISSTKWVGKTDLSTHCLGMMRDCNVDKILVCKSLLLLESEIITESVRFKLESRPLLVPLWPNPPI